MIIPFTQAILFNINKITNKNLAKKKSGYLMHMIKSRN